jgi:hypothetical protein
MPTIFPSTAKRTFAAALLAALTGCASTGAPSTGAPSTGAPATYNDCLYARSLRDWRPLDDEHLLLFGPGRTAYLVELFRPAMRLGFNIMIGVYDRDGRICPYGGDAIIVDGPMPERIPIRSMRRLTAEQLDEVYVQFGIRPPAVVEQEGVEPDNGAQ